MSVIWLVSGKRFVQEYHNHIRNIDLKYVNWFVDVETSYIRMYITAQGSNEVYCYVHREDYGSMPSEFKDMVSEKGMVLGMVDDSEVNGMTENLAELANEIKGLKFNQVTQ